MPVTEAKSVMRRADNVLGVCEFGVLCVMTISIDGCGPGSGRHLHLGKPAYSGVATRLIRGKLTAFSICGASGGSLTDCLINVRPLPYALVQRSPGNDASPTQVLNQALRLRQRRLAAWHAACG